MNANGTSVLANLKAWWNTSRKPGSVPVVNEHPDERVGFQLRHTLDGHSDAVNVIAWSPTGDMLASPSDDDTIHMWETDTGKLRGVLHGHTNIVHVVAWSPDGRTLASGARDTTVRLWTGETGRPVRVLKCSDFIGKLAEDVYGLAWSPDGRRLAALSDTSFYLWDAGSWEREWPGIMGASTYSGTLAWSPDGQRLAVPGHVNGPMVLWDIQSGKTLCTLSSAAMVSSAAWSPGGRLLAVGYVDSTIRLWDGLTGQLKVVLEGHTGMIVGLSFSYDTHVLASKSVDGTVLLWRSDTWKPVSELRLQQESISKFSDCLAFHPHAPILATIGDAASTIRIWVLDLKTILGAPVKPLATYYSNAKVVLAGDSGVGKSGLSLVLAGESFVATESTHGRHVWAFSSEKVRVADGIEVQRETLLWDLAGQPGYRLIHQLHLNEVAVALVVFDAHSETDPFAGIRYWDRALRVAQRIGDNGIPLKKILVAARMDRGGIGVGNHRIQSLVQELGFDAYFATSAKENWSICLLYTSDAADE